MSRSDEFKENNTVLIYEGHNAPQTGGIDPKTIDQPERTPSGTLTQNGKFHEAHLLPEVARCGEDRECGPEILESNVPLERGPRSQHLGESRDAGRDRS